MLCTVIVLLQFRFISIIVYRKPLLEDNVTTHALKQRHNRLRYCMLHRNKINFIQCRI